MYTVDFRQHIPNFMDSSYFNEKFAPGLGGLLSTAMDKQVQLEWNAMDEQVQLEWNAMDEEVQLEWIVIADFQLSWISHMKKLPLQGRDKQLVRGTMPWEVHPKKVLV